MPTTFQEVAQLLERLETKRKRKEIVEVTAEFLKRLEKDELAPAVCIMLGKPFPRSFQARLDVNWATLWSAISQLVEVDPHVFNEVFNATGDVGSSVQAVLAGTRQRQQVLLSAEKLLLVDVQRLLMEIARASGEGSRCRKERLLLSLMAMASPLESKYLTRLLLGEMRMGLNEGLLSSAVSRAFQVPAALVTRAVMFLGDLCEVAVVAKLQGAEGLKRLGFTVFQPVKLMLAQTAEDVNVAFRAHGGVTAFEYKYDGVRVQIHKRGGEVRLFSRRLTDVTASLPEIVEAACQGLRAQQGIVEGEVVAVDASGHAFPFQHLMRRVKRLRGISRVAKALPLQLRLFDILYLDGRSLVDLPYTERRRILAEVAGELPLAEQLVTGNREEAERFLSEAVNAGHEGLMAKKLDSAYVPGLRGKSWLKIKPVLDPLDLVIVAAEYGYGRRHGLLSDYYLAAKDDGTGRFLTVGKTFKGLTDKEIAEMTVRLKALTVASEEKQRVYVRPEVVVEVAYNEIQESSKYESGYALRFARITRIREDKAPDEADTIQRVREIYTSQFTRKRPYSVSGEHRRRRRHALDR